jgi:hypothetical protein
VASAPAAKRGYIGKARILHARLRALHPAPGELWVHSRLGESAHPVSAVAAIPSSPKQV